MLEMAEAAIQAAQDLRALDAVRVTYLGKQGQLTGALKALSALPPEERALMGQKLNLIKQSIQTALDHRRTVLSQDALSRVLAQNAVDVSLPGRGAEFGHIHPITHTLQRVEAWFTQLGFRTVMGPEIEDDLHNFEALNIPKHHPARAMHDTFYFPQGTLLRTHTSSVQVRTLAREKPPLRILSMGRVYRNEMDVTHTPMFHQIEGLWIDKQIAFSDLKGVLQAFISAFFEKSLKTRFRASYFPFTEPSAEVDMQCVVCQGADPLCRLCKGTGWLEVLGCGMVHPVVLENCGVDPEEYTGFAFGMGADRLTMLRYGISDLRLLFENDLRFLAAF
jgi:phenylalanyl-tRNA synthetase alpha chain